MVEFPLLPIPAPEADRRPKGGGGGSNLRLPDRRRQGQRLQPVFQRLRDVFDHNRDPLTLREDPAGIAPERAIVLEVAGSVDKFQDAVQHVSGLEYLGDEEFEFDADADFAVRDTRKDRKGKDRDDKPVGGRLYLAMPDTRALQELLRLWDRYQTGEQADTGFGPWFEVFRHLYHVRAWGPLDRISDETIAWLREELDARPDTTVRIEVELWSYQSPERRHRSNMRFNEIVQAAEGTVVTWASIPEIAYEAALVDLPAAEVHRLIRREEVHIVVCDDVMFVRPQSTAMFPTAVDALGAGGPIEPMVAEELPPIAALLDGMPAQRHRLLDSRLVFDDPDDLDSLSVVSERRHGTEMASLILHGDRNLAEPSLKRPLYLRPVLYAPGSGAMERPLPNRLLIDTIYRAVIRMKIGDEEGDATAPTVFLVNLSLGDERRPFAGPMSPWGRLLDYLAERFGILFLVSAGNIHGALQVSAFKGIGEMDSATPAKRERAILEALGAQRSQRTLLSPAEALNVVTVGSWHEDAFHTTSQAQLVWAPYVDEGPNITSAMGLGHRKVVKPEIFMPGGRERVRFAGADATWLSIQGVSPGRNYGLKAAMPDAGGRLDQEGSTGGTSAATALATRAAHRLFDALMDPSNGALLSDVDPMYYAVIVKALLVHRARWGKKGELLEGIYGPTGRGTHVARRDNIARILGYGRPNVEEALSCDSNRATLVGFGSVTADGSADLYRIPLPESLERVTEPRAVTLTLAWFSPVNVRHRAYRRAKLEVQPDRFQEQVGVQRSKLQPSDISVPRGSLFHVHYDGKNAVPFVDDGSLRFRVFCREQGGTLDQDIRYGLAVTIEAGEYIPVYQEIRQRLRVQP